MLKASLSVLFLCFSTKMQPLPIKPEVFFLKLQFKFY